MLSDDLLSIARAEWRSRPRRYNSYIRCTSQEWLQLPRLRRTRTSPRWLVWREDADSIYFRDSRGQGGTLTITATPLGGGGLTTS